MTDMEALRESSWEQSLCGLLALAKTLYTTSRELADLFWKASGSPSGKWTKNSADFKEVSRRLDELKLSRMHYVSEHPRNVRYYVLIVAAVFYFPAVIGT